MAQQKKPIHVNKNSQAEYAKFGRRVPIKIQLLTVKIHSSLKCISGKSQ